MGAIQSEARLRPEQVMLLRLFKRGGLVLLALAWLDRPAGEGELAAILEVDRQTVRSYLSSLQELGLVTRTHHRQGYRLTEGCRGVASGQIAGRMGEFSPFEPSSTAESSLTILESPEKEEEKEARKSGEKLTIQAQENLAAFRAQGIGLNGRVKRACGLEHVSPEFIQAQAGRLRAQGRFSPGLLLLAVENNDPMPGAASNPDDEAGRQRFVSGRFAAFIEH